jgi:hypothetical protein
MTKMTYEVDKIYHMAEFKDSFKLQVIASNRHEKKQVDKKLESCEEVGMQVPGILTPSQTVCDAGYTLLDAITGEKATDEEIVEGLTIVEGNTRFHAWVQALDKASKDSSYTVFDYIFIVKEYTSAEEFQNAYRKMNMDNVPTKTKDFTRDMLATSNNMVLMSYNDKIKDGLVAKAAGFATANQEIMKDDLEKCFNGKTPKVLSDDSILDYTTPVYEATLRAFASEKRIKPVLKGTAVWKFNASMLNKPKEEDREVVKQNLIDMYDNLTSRTYSRIIEAKGQGNKTKEQVIHAILKDAYDKVVAQK